MLYALFLFFHSFFFSHKFPKDFVKDYLEKDKIDKIFIEIHNESSHFTAEANIVLKENRKTVKMVVGNLDYFLENLEKFQMEKQVFYLINLIWLNV